MKKTTALREKLHTPQVIRAVGAHTALNAKLIEQAGFDAIWAGGLEISAGYTLPDANILTMTQYLQAASDMNVAVTIPVIADCDSGFGNVNNVIHAVREYERHGIAGICIEDKLFPKLNSFVAGNQDLAPLHEFVAKIQAAKDTQTDQDFVVIARTEALIAEKGMEEALKRAKAYEDAGADALLIHSKEKTPEQIMVFLQETSTTIPIVIVPTTYPQISYYDLEGSGVNMIIYANHVLRSTIRAVQQMLKKLYSDGTTEHIEDSIADLHEVFEMQGMFEMRKKEDYYMKKANPTMESILEA